MKNIKPLFMTIALASLLLLSLTARAQPPTPPTPPLQDLQNQITQEVADRIAADQQEATNRDATDQALQIQIDDLVATDKLGDLPCTTAGQIAKYNGSEWECAADETEAPGNQVHFFVRTQGYYLSTLNGTEQIQFTDPTGIFDNTGDVFDPDTGIFTIPVSGVYTLHGAVSVGPFSSNAHEEMGAIMYAGGKSIYGTYVKPIVGSHTTATVSTTLYLQAGSVVRLYSWAVTDGDYLYVLGGNYTNVYTYLSGALVR